MLRISKLADYATKLMLSIAKEPERLYSATELALQTKVAAPTVSKLLKKLSKHQLLNSSRGSQGGYQLARSAVEISLADIVECLDGEVAMTECVTSNSCCDFEADCQAKGNWSAISKIINDVLKNISLEQMQQPIVAKDIPIKFYSKDLT